MEIPRFVRRQFEFYYRREGLRSPRDVVAVGRSETRKTREERPREKDERTRGEKALEISRSELQTALKGSRVGRRCRELEFGDDDRRFVFLMAVYNLVYLFPCGSATAKLVLPRREKETSGNRVTTRKRERSERQSESKGT